MSSPSIQTPVLSQSAYHVLSESGENITIRDGWQTIRRAALSESSSSDSEASIKVPIVVESLETLEFLGFTPEAGKAILELFNKVSGSSEVPCFLEFVKGHVMCMPDVGCPEDDWNATILAMGITQTLCDKILDPEFTELLLTENASYWVIDTIEAKFEFLKSLNAKVLRSE